MDTLKKCNKCKQLKPLTDYYRRGPNGKTQAICARCYQVRDRKHPGTCAQCQRSFVSTNPGQKYCSVECCNTARWSTMYDEEGRTCTRCKVYKPWANYHQRSRGAGGRQPHCIDCEKTRKEKVLYDITPTERTDIMAGQRGRCPGCKRTFAGGVSYSVDHCHESGAVRGLLCDPCNITLGHYKTVERLLAAATFLERHNARLGVTPPSLPD